MAGDVSRSTFNPGKRYSGVRQQQGRVNLDADWNEQVDIADHRLSMETVDVIGSSGAPRNAAAFGLAELPTPPPSPPIPPGADLAISAGRMYVAGRVCELASTPVAIENFTGDGTGPAGNQVQLASLLLDGAPLLVGQWAQITAQAPAGSAALTPLFAQITAVNPNGSVTFSAAVSSFGSPNTSPQLQRVTTYLTQPDYPQPPALPTSGSAILYLDVWERTITFLQDPSIQEIALGGPDTATRTKIVWQLKVLPLPAGSVVSCSTPDSSISTWQTQIAPSSGLLTNGVLPSSSGGPCSIASTNGYNGVENQLYRVEIHQPGTLAGGVVAFPIPAGTATFKWSRDNASVSTGVTAIAPVASSTGVSSSQLTVLSTGRDAVLSFAPQGWIEITDDFLDLHGQPGELHQIDSNGVDPTRSTITLTTPVSAALLARFSGTVNYHTRICRWDQGGQILQAGTGTLWIDLNAAGSTGDIPVPPPGTTLLLENNVTVSFSLSSSTGSLNTADAWTFAARTADGSVESLTLAPPSAIRHQYCRLGTISFDASPWAITDCRQLFTPLADAGIHVTAVSLTGVGQLLNDSTITLQQLASGISISCDGALDPASVSQPNNTLVVAPATVPVSTAQATCNVTVGMPIVSGQSIYGFQPLTLGATVVLDTSQTTILWKPNPPTLAGLIAQMSALATQTSTTVPPTIPTVLAYLTLKGDAIWSKDNINILLDGETFFAPYPDSNNNQHTGLVLPSGDGRRGGDFSMWFWLTSSPPLTISPANLYFATTLVGATSGALNLTLSNTTGTAITLTFAITAEFLYTSSCGASIPAAANGVNGACTISVTFKPAGTGFRSGTLTITGAGSSLVIPLLGVGETYVLNAYPTIIAFGSLTVNTTGAPQIITLSNQGSNEVSVTGISTASTNYIHTSSCGAIAAGGTCSISVQFSPKGTGALNDALTITTVPAGLVPNIPLFGTGIQPKNATKDVNDAKAIRDAKTIKDKPKGNLEQIVGRPVDFGPVLLQKAKEEVEPATGRAFIQPEERPAVGQRALEAEPSAAANEKETPEAQQKPGEPEAPPSE